MRARGGRGEERACNCNQSAVGEDRMRAEDDLVHAGHDRVDGRVRDEEGGDSCGGERARHVVPAVRGRGFCDDDGVVAGVAGGLEERLDGLGVSDG